MPDTKPYPPELTDVQVGRLIDYALANGIHYVYGTLVERTTCPTCMGYPMHRAGVHLNATKQQAVAYIQGWLKAGRHMIPADDPRAIIPEHAGPPGETHDPETSPGEHR